MYGIGINDDTIARQAAEECLREGGDEELAAIILYALAFGRFPSPQEIPDVVRQIEGELS